MKTEFSTFDIIRKLGIPHGRLRMWMDNGFVVPSIQKSSGHGSRSLFSRFDIYAIVYFKYLIDNLHLPRNEAANIIRGWLRDINVMLARYSEEDILKALSEHEMDIIWLHDETVYSTGGNEIFSYLLLKDRGEKKSSIERQFDFFRNRVIRDKANTGPVIFIPFKEISEEARKLIC